MATLNPTNAIATQAVHHAAAQLAALDWIDQEAARQLSPMAEAVANMFMVLYYQAETGQATRDDSRQALDAVRDEIAAAGGRALAIPTDVTDEDAVADLFARAHAEDGHVDILVNNAGIAGGGPVDELTLATWQRVIDVNLTGAFLCSRAALRVMKPRRRGRILNIGSISAQMPRVHSVPYTTSKFGLEGMTRALALEARPYGIAVSVLHPGNTTSAIWEGREEQTDVEGIMPAAEVARVALLMVTLPPEINMLESVVLPVRQPFLGRG